MTSHRVVPAALVAAGLVAAGWWPERPLRQRAPGVDPVNDWRQRARCRDTDPETFFPVGTTGPAEAQLQAAKAICAPCQVREECLRWALDTGQDAGVWGGLSEEERRELRRGRKRAQTKAIA